MTEYIMGEKLSLNLDANFRLFLRLMRSRMVVYKAMEQNYLDGFGLSVEQMAVLTLCNNDSPVYPSQIAKILFRKPSTISGHLKFLEKKGLLSINIDPKKRSRIVARTTVEGKEIVENSSHLEMVSQYFDNMTEEEKAELNRLLQMIYDNNIDKLQD